jgi:uncharacterized phage-associated protein
MAKALDVAKYFIQLAQSEDEPDQLSHLRLQKLLYYAQGWSLALRKKALFAEEIQAWAHGPVVASVYPTFAKFGSNCIQVNENSAESALTEDECELVQSVWNVYKKFSAIKLREMTHSEAPWKEAHKGYEPGERCTAEITKPAMKKFFTTLAPR